MPKLAVWGGGRKAPSRRDGTRFAPDPLINLFVGGERHLKGYYLLSAVGLGMKTQYVFARFPTKSLKHAHLQDLQILRAACGVPPDLGADHPQHPLLHAQPGAAAGQAVHLHLHGRVHGCAATLPCLPQPAMLCASDMGVLLWHSLLPSPTMLCASDMRALLCSLCCPHLPCSSVQECSCDSRWVAYIARLPGRLYIKASNIAAALPICMCLSQSPNPRLAVCCAQA